WRQGVRRHHRLSALSGQSRGRAFPRSRPHGLRRPWKEGAGYDAADQGRRRVPAESVAVALGILTGDLPIPDVARASRSNAARSPRSNAVCPRTSNAVSAAERRASCAFVETFSVVGPEIACFGDPRSSVAESGAISTSPTGTAVTARR